MRGLLCGFALATGCGEVKGTKLPDAGPLIDAAIDAGCQPVLLVGGMPVEPQGWSVVMQAPATLSYGPDFTKLVTTTPVGARVGGQLLLNLPAALPMTGGFAIEVVLLVEQVAAHNPSDAAVAILGSFSSGFGTPAERDQMIYLDAGAIGWADDSQKAAATITDNAYHTVGLAVDTANVATVTLDGARVLTRTGFVTNGALAIGDQTNEPAVDSTIRIKSVTRQCR